MGKFPEIEKVDKSVFGESLNVTIKICKLGILKIFSFLPSLEILWTLNQALLIRSA